MTLKYILKEEDFLIYQLYTSSKKDSVRKTRRKSLLWVIALFLIISAMFYDRDDMLKTYLFIGMAFLSIIFYPLYLSDHYKKHYRKFIIENYKNRFNKEADVSFEADFFISSSESSETKIGFSEIEEMNEIENYIFFKLKSGGGLIIRKSGIEDLNSLKDYLKKLSTELNVKYIEDLNWKWK